MKNLVLSALLFAGLTQAAGCIIVADDTSDATGDVSVSWALKSSDGSGATIPSICPSGADTIRINAQFANDTPFTDTFLCSAAGSGIADRLPVGQYAVWVTITDTNGVNRFAESEAHLVDVVDGGTSTTSLDVFTDRAFFQVGWHLTVGGGPTSCAAEGAEKVSVLATVSGGVNAFDDDSNRCVDGEGGKSVLTQVPVPLGPYTVVVAALDAVGASLGDSDALVNQQLDYGNEFLLLGENGNVEIPIR